jgi:PIN domain nuclease of toxin-antitoxin system
LALLFAEPGAETVADVIADGAVMSSVNLSEVATLLVRHGQDPSKTLLPVLEQVSVEAFTVDDTLAAAALSPRTAPNGLSLADRACLALAKRLNAPAVTADRAWSQLDINVAVHMIRS